MLISRRQDPVSKDLSKAPVADALKALEDVVGVRRVVCAVLLFDSDDARGSGSELCRGFGFVDPHPGDHRPRPVRECLLRRRRPPSEGSGHV